MAWSCGLARPPTSLRIRAASLAPFRIHDLRHSSATLKARAGIPIEVISADLGHANSNITRRIYLHVLPVARKESAAAWDAIRAQGRAERSSS
jgi:integrase